MSDKKIIDRTAELAQEGPDILVIDGDSTRPPTREEAKKMGITYIDWSTTED